MKFSFRKLVWQLMQYLPDDVRFAIIRSRIDIGTKGQLDGFKFKIATTQEEIEQGFRLLYESYRESGLMNENSSELRITKYHLMPTSSMIIGKKGEEVVATVTHVLDSPFGLPCDDQGDLSEMRKTPNAIAEVSALAIKRGYRRNYALLFALTRFLYNYSVYHCGVRYWVICISSRVQDYYKAIFFFTPLSEKTFNYDFVNGNPSVTLKADLHNLVGLFENHYKSLPPEKNLYDFYLKVEREEHDVYPDFVFKTSTLPIFNTEMLNYFFNQKVSVLNDLTPAEKQEVLNAYHDPIYESLIERDYNNVVGRRKDPRRTANIRGFILFSEGEFNQIINGSIVNFSRGGLLFYSAQVLPEGPDIEIQAEIVRNQTILVRAKIIAKISETKYACRVEVEKNPAWGHFIDNIESHLREFSPLNKKT